MTGGPLPPPRPRHPLTFVQTEFIWFFAAVFTLYWVLRRRRFQNFLLLAASVVFYGWVHPWFLILLFFTAIQDYLAGIAIERWPGRKGWFLGASLAGNLGLLAYFKYADFFLENVRAGLDALGVPSAIGPIGVFLPVGISFYTFQSLSYTIDVYRGHTAARRDLVDYFLFVTFFPQLVAGPILRADSLLVQVERPRRLSWAAVEAGMALAMWGAFKKVCVADTLADYIDKIFLLKEPNAALVWAATLGFGVQILADFSGYTDIARGLARMMGFDLPLNFDHPYLARSPSDFWRRWHISFSSWIRDYIYIPLGGSRHGATRMVLAAWVAMLASGFWHGARWNFVIWGAYHAALLTAYRFVTPRVPRRVREARGSGVAAVVLMFALTTVGWLVFRTPSLPKLVQYVTLPPLGGTPDQFAAAAVMLAVTLTFSAPLVLALLWERHVAPRLEGRPVLLPIRTTAWAAAAVAMFVFARMDTNDFIYFQF